MKDAITKRQVIDYLYALPPEEVEKIVKGYDKGHKTKLQEIMEVAYASELQFPKQPNLAPQSVPRKRAVEYPDHS